MGRGNSTELAVICADIGSVKTGRFGWAAVGSDRTALGSGRDPGTLVDLAAALLGQGTRVALGFEAPLFVPLRDEPARLTAARPGEGSRPWSAGAGTGALATGLVQVTWILRELRGRLSPLPRVHFAWESFEAEGGMLLWEAMVTGDRKATGDDPHVGDALAGAGGFVDALPDPSSASLINAGGPAISLVGLALLRSDWSADLALLSAECLVIAPRRPVRETTESEENAR